MTEIWMDAVRTQAELAEKLRAATTSDELAALRTESEILLRSLRDQLSSELDDVGAAEFNHDKNVIEKAAIISRLVSVGPLPGNANAPPALREITAAFAGRIVNESTLRDFDSELKAATADAQAASLTAIKLQAELEQYQRLRPLLTEFESLLDALAAVNYEKEMT